MQCLFIFWLDEPDDFYEFTAEDYYRILATKKEGNLPLASIYSWVYVP